MLFAVLVEAVANLAAAARNLVVRLLPAPEFVVLTARGALPERRPPALRWLQRRLVRRWVGEPEESLEEWRDRLDVLQADPRVRGVVLRLGPLRAGLASLESLRAALARFRASGKRVVAFLTACDLPGYYLASVADTVVAPESAELLLLGLTVEATFVRAALDRLGIRAQYHHIAEYKTAAHRFLYPKMTGPQREMLEAVLQTSYGHLTAAIADSRRLSPADVQAAVDAGVLSGAQAHSRRLVDAVAYEDELPALLGTPQRPARVVPWARAARRVVRRVRWRAAARQAVGVVQVLGTIVPGESRELPVPLPLVGRRLAGSDTVARALRAAERSPAVKAVVLHVDSPGGSALTSDLIWREVGRLQRRKPVVVHMGPLAGSGGYYVGCGAAHIVCGETTLTGSIGVVAGKLSVRGLAARAGITREILFRGESATFSSPHAEFTDAQEAALRRWMDEVYRRFLGRVAAGRRRPVEEVEAVARGRVWTGRDAVARGLADEVGDFETAVRRARDLAGIPPAADVPVLTIQPPPHVPLPGSPAAWAEALRAVRALLAEPAWLLAPWPAVR